jgi:pyridoxal phosphate enzyme (YggS family)
MKSDRIRDNLESIRARMAEAARRSERAAGAVTLVAVTKKCPMEFVQALIVAGALELGENYPQELWRIVDALAHLDSPIRWHLIGHLQSNKARRTMPMVKMIHAVDSLRLLRTLDTLAAEMPEPPSVCLQVNTSAEATKHGWSAEEILADADDIAACAKIPVVGLMTMAAWGTSAHSARPSFVLLRETRDALGRRTGLPLLELSMGMSGDFETAIEEGATLVRIGTALFEGVVK